MTSNDGQNSSAASNRPLFWNVLLAVSTCACSWLTMMVVHELGHVLHAAASGGHVTGVVLHPLRISRTDVEPNPHPSFVVWGGPVWGSLIPLAFAILMRRTAKPYHSIALFFAGFCLVANGAYIGSGVFYPAGDSEQLLQLGTPSWMLATFGLLNISAGLLCWHRLGSLRQIVDSSQAHRTAAIVMCVLTLAIAAFELRMRLDGKQ